MGGHGDKERWASDRLPWIRNPTEEGQLHIATQIRGDTAPSCMSSPRVEKRGFTFYIWPSLGFLRRGKEAFFGHPPLPGGRMTFSEKF